ncbi:disks large-associated protein 5 isoform X2 [Mastacembelus armatus]|uniref:disks large-associated protein 5 isoform X2 n=1 Tax=Mastacembelus armatus TaxID=205130 RepID=UPI000E458435|nr:disks large-associated protein 5 isoform X2 [Mastacembelus armatus]
MESRFAHLRQRDTSVSMLRVKMSRRRSQSQKENRERAVNTRRQLDKLPELEMSSLDASIAISSLSIIQEKTQNNAKSAKTHAAEERMKQLERWKERKALEKEKKERDCKGVFKTGLYHPKDNLTISLPVVSAAPKTKETKVSTAPSQSDRVTRSMKQQQQVQKPLKKEVPNVVAKRAQTAVERPTRSRVAPVKPTLMPTTSKTKVCAVEPTVRALSGRSTNRPPVTTVPLVNDKPKDKGADVRTTRSRVIVNTVASLSGKERSHKAVNNMAQPSVPKEPEVKKPEMQEPEEKPHPPTLTLCSEEEDMVVDPSPADSVSTEEPIVTASSLSSFAPQGFTFQAPAGLSSFKFEPLTPRSADAFLTPSSSFSLPPAPVFTPEPEAESGDSSPPKSPRRSPHTSPIVAPLNSGSPLESMHDVPYFRSEIANETDRLTSLCVHWESKVKDESIPEEMRDRMRTAVGQARLLMKERFNQFSGLVDDCELGRGEKITTCTDLQGFWDMVYFQVEDVTKKFNALKEAEDRGWVEEHKPPPQQRKAVKKPPTAAAKPTGSKAAAKSRLAAIKAAMKARQQAAEAEKAAKDAGNTEDNLCHNPQEPQPQAEAHMSESLVFDGGFFRVESPAKHLVRRSSRLSAAVNSKLDTPTPVRSIPSIAVAEEQDKPATAIDADFPLSSRLSLSPCKTPPPSSQAPEPSSSLSFTLSPCATASQPPIPSTAAVHGPEEAQESMCRTPDSSVVEEIPGLDFERYLQPSQRCSPSPRGTVAIETLSPMAMDVELDSPEGQYEDPLTQQEPAGHSVLTLQSPQVQTAESALLLFTPDVKDRIRQSVCPSDLMVFTPPSNA